MSGVLPGFAGFWGVLFFMLLLQWFWGSWGGWLGGWGAGVLAGARGALGGFGGWAVLEQHLSGLSFRVVRAPNLVIRLTI